MDETPASGWPKPHERFALVCACLRAIGELALARIRHLSLEPRDILALNAAGSGSPPTICDPHSRARVEQVAYVIPRIAARLPWRADCLVQALAAQRWLRRCGIASQITIGVDRTPEGEFAAHAWLTQAGRVVTGGEISRYRILLTPDGGA